MSKNQLFFANSKINKEIRQQLPLADDVSHDVSEFGDCDW